MPLTFESNEQMRHFADQLYYAMRAGSPEVTAQFDKQNPFADSIAYLKGFANKETKDSEGKTYGPASDLLNHIYYASAVYQNLREAADYDTAPERRKTLIEEAQVILDRMSDSEENDPDMLCAEFYRFYGYGKATDSSMKFISDAFHSVRNARCLMTARELRQEYETCSNEMDEIKAQSEELIDNSKTYLRNMYKIGTSRGSFDNLYHAQDSFVKAYEKSLANLQSNDFVTAQRTAAKKELDEINAKYNKLAAPLNAFEKQKAKVDEYLKTLKSEKTRKAFEMEEKKYDNAVSELEKHDEHIQNIKDRIQTNELRAAQSQAYKDGLARIEAENPGIEQAIADNQSWHERAEALHNAVNTMVILASKKVDIGALLAKKDGYTAEEAEYLDQYDKAKNDIIKNLNTSPEGAKQNAEAFRSIENGEEDVLTAFTVKYQFPVSTQISELNARMREFESVYGSRVGEYCSIKDQLEQNASCEVFLKEERKELESVLKKRKTLESNLKKCEAARQSRTKEVCDNLGFRNDKGLVITYEDAIKSAESLSAKLGEQIKFNREITEFNVLASQKSAAEKKYDSVSKKSVSKRIKAIKTGLELEKKKLDKYQGINKTRDELKTKLQNLSDNEVAIQDKHKGLVKTTVQSKLQHSLFAISSHLMDRSSRERIENRDRNSPEFNAMRDKLDEVFNILSSQSNATKEEKTAALTELGNVAKQYYDAKMAQHVPNIFASEQRHARLECAKSIMSLCKIAKSIEYEVPACEAAVSKFISSNVHVGASKLFEQNFEKMLDIASEELHKEEPDLKIEKHALGEHMSAELEKLEAENSIEK